MTFLDNSNKHSIVSVIIAIAAVCAIFGIMQGVHDNYGIMLNSLSNRTGLGYAAVSFVIGVGALIYGVAQPFMGMIALKRSNTFVMLLGIVMTACGLIVTPFCKGFITFLIFFGLVLPIGTTGLASGILMSAITPLVGEKRAVIVSGILQASAGVGDALMAPGMERFISLRGIAPTMTALSIPFLVMIPMAIWIGNKEENSRQEIHEDNADKTETLRHILSDAFRDRDYRCILIGFATCGFNMSIIESHLFSQYISYGIQGSTASLTLTVYGITTMLGAILTGFLGSKFKMKNVLGTVYAVRVFISMSFLFLPKSVPFAFIMTGLIIDGEYGHG